MHLYQEVLRWLQDVPAEARQQACADEPAVMSADTVVGVQEHTTFNPLLISKTWHARNASFASALLSLV